MKTYNRQLQEQLEKYMADNGISQNKLAPQIGVSTAALSQYRNSSYDKGDVSAVEAKIEEFFRLKNYAQETAEKAAAYLPATDYVPTSISEDVYETIRYCQAAKGMVIVHGDAGVGKTKGAEKFIRENPTASIYIQATPSTGTLSGVLKMLARALHISDMRNKIDLMFAIRDKLDGTNKVIIIDEAQHLKLAALEEIRTLSDPSGITDQPGIGICLIGNTEVYSRMLGKQEARFAQLFSRVRMNRHYSTNKVKLTDVKQLFPRLADGQQKKELEFLLGISRSKWGIRGAVNVYNNAINNNNMSYDGLVGMARNMGIGVL